MPAKTPAAAPRLHHIAALWTLLEHPSPAREWSLEKKFETIKAAGFDGVADLLDARHARLAAKHGLLTIGYMRVFRAAEFRKLILQNLEGGARRINVQLGDHDTPVEQSVRLAIRLVEEGEKLGCPCDIEVHRGTSTETAEKTYAIAAGFRRATGRLLPMTWDFSHIASVKHLEPPYHSRLLVAPALVRHARQFHFRPFNGHHCQIPVTDGRGRLAPEFKQWLPFLEKTIELIVSRRDGRDIFACPELGPINGGYNLAQLPSSWEDAKLLRGIIADTWARALRAAPSAA